MRFSPKMCGLFVVAAASVFGCKSSGNSSGVKEGTSLGSYASKSGDKALLTKAKTDMEEKIQSLVAFLDKMDAENKADANMIRKVMLLDQLKLRQDAVATKLSYWAPPVGTPFYLEPIAQGAALVGLSAWGVACSVAVPVGAYAGGVLVGPGMAFVMTSATTWVGAAVGGTYAAAAVSGVGVVAAEVGVLVFEVATITQIWRGNTQYGDVDKAYDTLRTQVDQLKGSGDDRKETLRDSFVKLFQETKIKPQDISLSSPSYGLMANLGVFAKLGYDPQTGLPTSSEN
jgi:hypothetical protein